VNLNQNWRKLVEFGKFLIGWDPEPSAIEANSVEMRDTILVVTVFVLLFVVVVLPRLMAH
jgi:hypothetical protein